WIEMAASARGYAWAIERRDEPGLIGCIRFNYIARPSFVGGIGYELHPRFWGQGLMTEAVQAIVAVGHDRLQLNRIEAWTLPGNGAS
ncbi:GNAT family N-acetyltransferase, partial [Vibrio parahaemolyticus]